MINIMRPLLPTADKIYPYLRRIDSSHHYSNNGPLNQEYEQRLSEIYNCYVVTTSSATSGLTAALLAVIKPTRNTSIAVPSWTFVASVSAIISAGFSPAICDVNDHDILDLNEIPEMQGYMFVAPFGKPVVCLSNTTVIDAASGFDSYQTAFISDVPVVISTHCTKIFGTGEGAFILTKSKYIADMIRRISNQGMLPDKSVSEPGINAKMSEYHAAVGLAELDGWNAKRQRWMQIAEWYGDETPYATSTRSILLEHPAAPIVKLLESKGVQARTSWYGTCHKQEPFRKYAVTPLPRTDMLAERTIFLPKFIGMTKEDVNYIRSSLEECLGEYETDHYQPGIDEVQP